jgi:multidrug resistance efflux pump
MRRRAPLGERPRQQQAAHPDRSNTHHAGDGRGCGLARLGDVEGLHGRALDARRHGAGLCRDDGARGGRTNRQAAGRGQSARAQGRRAIRNRSAAYRIALESAQAQAQRDAAALDYARADQTRKATLAKEGWTPTEIYEQTTSTLRQAEAVVALDQAAVAKAQLDLSRTVIRSPANGYVTNLLTQLGDYANIGQKIISVVDADSFWVDGYFEETSLGRIHEGDPATIKLMGYSQLVRGHVGGVARGINVPNAQPDPAGLASVNPIFTWVRLAQRVPVRIHIDQVPDGVRLVAGMTATVQIDQPEPSKR